MNGPQKWRPGRPFRHAWASPFCFGYTTVCATYEGSIGLHGLGVPTKAAGLCAPKGNGYEHRAIHRQRGEVERRGVVHEGDTAVSPVRLLRTGRANPRP